MTRKETQKLVTHDFQSFGKTIITWMERKSMKKANTRNVSWEEHGQTDAEMQKRLNASKIQAATGGWKTGCDRIRLLSSDETSRATACFNHPQNS